LFPSPAWQSFHSCLFFRLYWWSNSESMQQFCGGIGWHVCWLASLLIILYVYAEANDVARSRHKIGALKSATGTFHPVVTWQARCDTTATYWYLQIILSHCINDPNMTCDDPALCTKRRGKKESDWCVVKSCESK
jgi:hypothetical protein